MNQLKDFALISLVAGVVASIASPFIFQSLVRAKSRQTISQFVQEHAHKQGTPTMGGLIILIGLLAGIAFRWHAELTGVVTILVGYGILGFFDDYLIPRLKPGSRGFEWLPKLGLQLCIAALGIWLSGLRDLPVIICGIIIVLFFCNAFNFSDGLDTLAGGLGLLIAVGLVGLVSLTGKPDVLVLVACPALVGALVPFLFLNAPPARIFMGDVGSLPIGGMFGLLFVRILTTTSFTSTGLPLLVLSGVMLVEIIPVPIQIASVKLLGKRAFPFKTPVHHGLQANGWPETRIVWSFHLAQIILTLSAWTIAGKTE